MAEGPDIDAHRECDVRRDRHRRLAASRVENELGFRRESLDTAKDAKSSLRVAIGRFTGDSWDVGDVYRALVPGEYLPYPPVSGGVPVGSQVEAVNQIPQLAEWRPHVSRLMHGWAAFHGDREYKALTDTQRDVLTRQVVGLAGHGWWSLDFWSRLVNPDGRPIATWQLARIIPERAVIAICAMCNTETWPRRTARRLDFDAFKRYLDSGFLYGVNQEGRRWRPSELVTTQSRGAEEVPTSASIAGFHAGLALTADFALDWYDDYVAHTETAHGHE